MTTAKRKVLFSIHKVHALIKYFSVCTVPIFSRMTHHYCDDMRMIELYRHIADLFTQLAIYGDGDRRCVYATENVRCSLMNFYSSTNPVMFSRKLHLLANDLYKNCGKEGLRVMVAPKLKRLQNAAYKCTYGKRVTRQLTDFPSTTIFEPTTVVKKSTTGTTTTTTPTTQIFATKNLATICTASCC